MWLTSPLIVGRTRRPIVRRTTLAQAAKLLAHSRQVRARDLNIVIPCCSGGGCGDVTWKPVADERVWPGAKLSARWSWGKQRRMLAAANSSTGKERCKLWNWQRCASYPFLNNSLGNLRQLNEGCRLAREPAPLARLNRLAAPVGSFRFWLARGRRRMEDAREGEAAGSDAADKERSQVGSSGNSLRHRHRRRPPLLATIVLARLPAGGDFHSRSLSVCVCFCAICSLKETKGFKKTNPTTTFYCSSSLATFNS